jgi:two-component system sensor kinase FixL
MNLIADTNRELSILEGAVENANDGFVTIDENHNVIFFNKAAEWMFGYAREEVVGKDLNYILTPDCSSDHKAAVARYCKSREPRLIGHASELKATRKNGETFPALISFSVSEVDGEIFFTGIVRDLTETKALQEQLLESERLAALGKVTAEIAHEIKNPLIMIGGFARQVARHTDKEKNKERLGIIAGEVKRLERLLGELKEFYRPRELAITDVKINHLLKGLYSLSKEDAQKRKVQISMKLDKNAGVVEGDKDKLEQAFLNLIKNGIEAMGDGGKLSVITEAVEGGVTIKISDNGPGIPRHVKKKIYAPFFTTKKSGTGLGLSISKRIIDDHEGSFFGFTSREGEGTEFKITIPTRQPERQNR